MNAKEVLWTAAKVAVPVLTAALSIASKYIADKELDEKLTIKAAEAVAEVMNKEEA